MKRSMKKTKMLCEFGFLNQILINSSNNKIEKE